MKKTIIFLIGILLVGCGEMKREAIGAADEIMVVASKEDRAALNASLSKIFSDTLYTPQPEPIYKLKYVDPVGFSDLKQITNIIIGSLGTDASKQGTKLVKSLLGKDKFANTIDGDEHVIFSEDQFARNQLFMILSANSIEEINVNLIDKSDWIKSYFDKTFKKKQEKYLFGNDRLKKLTKQLKETYGWELKIPWGWEVIKESSDSNFVWLGRELPYQWISIHWEDGLVVKNSIDAMLYANQFVDNYYKSIKLSGYRYEIENVEFNNWNAWHSTGIWESNDEAQGGPFINYTFYDKVSDRTYNLNMLVFIPGKPKATFIRQLDIVAHSFQVAD